MQLLTSRSSPAPSRPLRSHSRWARNALASALVRGEKIAAVAVPHTQALDAANTGVQFDGSRLTGTIGLVAGALEADVLLVPADDSVLLVETADVVLCGGHLVRHDAPSGRSGVRPHRGQCPRLRHGGQRGLDTGHQISAALLASEQWASLSVAWR
ncbi:hypothetical protein [Aeromicrobium sp. UC242_57]|uniref:hypothetical protein n=1 Tax=Aeromicrobium sp. UC242_57 TaxID=3374624 RepID=UPI00379741F8